MRHWSEELYEELDSYRWRGRRAGGVGVPEVVKRSRAEKKVKHKEQKKGNGV